MRLLPTNQTTITILLLYLMSLLLLLLLSTAYFRFLLVDEELAKETGIGVLFFCVRGKHRSAATVAAYIARCTQLDPEVVMRDVSEISLAQRGHGRAARFHTRWREGWYPPLAPLVRATAVLSHVPQATGAEGSLAS